MRKLFGEYSQIIGYTCTGLVFGLSFFLLFLNFYHYKEVSIQTDKTKYVDDTYQKIMTNNEKIKNIVQNFDVNRYTGSENDYGLLSIQSRLEMCTKDFEDQKIASYFQKEKLSVSDIYDFGSLYNSKIVNSCIVKELYDFFASTPTNADSRFSSPKILNVTPIMKLEADSLIRRIDYVSSNLENNSSYYFNNKRARNHVFNVAKSSYYAIVTSYGDASDFLLEISNWFARYIGGAA